MTTASWTCCPPPAPPWGTGTTTRTTWSTPTCPSPWTCPRDTATASWNTSAGPPRQDGCAPGWRTTAGTSAVATPAGTTAVNCPWCCSCSRPRATRTPSWTPPATSITPPSPVPTWKPSHREASWLTRGCRPPRSLGKGCNCSDWSKCNFSGDVVSRGFL